MTRQEKQMQAELHRQKTSEAVRALNYFPEHWQIHVQIGRCDARIHRKRSRLRPRNGPFSIQLYLVLATEWYDRVCLPGLAVLERMFVLEAECLPQQQWPGEKPAYWMHGVYERGGRLQHFQGYAVQFAGAWHCDADLGGAWSGAIGPYVNSLRGDPYPEIPF